MQRTRGGNERDLLLHGAVVGDGHKSSKVDLNSASLPKPPPRQQTATMEDSASIFGLLPVPKKRRTVGRKPRTWNPEVSEADREDEAVSALLQLLKEDKGDSEKPEDALVVQVSGYLHVVNSGSLRGP